MALPKKVLVAHPTGWARLILVNELGVNELVMHELGDTKCLAHEAGTGIEMLGKVERTTFDLILLGQDMLGGSDWSVPISNIRGSERNKRTPVIAILGRAGEEASFKALEGGADATVALEPLNVEAFRARVLEWAGKSVDPVGNWASRLDSQETQILHEAEEVLSAEDLQTLKTTAAALGNAFAAAKTGGPIQYGLIAGNVEEMRKACNKRGIKKALLNLSGHDRGTYLHSLNVAVFADSIAQMATLGGEDRTLLWSASVLHDIGKIEIPLDVLNAPRALTPDERKIVEYHTIHAEELLSGHVPAKAVEIAVQHHEKVGGGGYPRGLRNGQIPFLPRIVAVADVFEAMIAQRPYKKPRTPAEAVKILKDASHFDQEVVKMFCPLVGVNYTAV